MPNRRACPPRLALDASAGAGQRRASAGRTSRISATRKAARSACTTGRTRACRPRGAGALGRAASAVGPAPPEPAPPRPSEHRVQSWPLRHAAPQGPGGALRRLELDPGGRAGAGGARPVHLDERLASRRARISASTSFGPLRSGRAARFPATVPARPREPTAAATVARWPPGGQARAPAPARPAGAARAEATAPAARSAQPSSSGLGSSATCVGRMIAISPP